MPMAIYTSLLVSQWFSHLKHVFFGISGLSTPHNKKFPAFKVLPVKRSHELKIVNDKEIWLGHNL